MDDIRLNAFREAPHNSEAEKALLGAIFINNRAYEKVSEYLRQEHFAFAQNGDIFAACGKLIDGGSVADPVTLQGIIDDGAYLMELAGAAVPVVNAGEYGRLIFDLYQRREIIEIGQALVEQALDGDVSRRADQIINAGRVR